jgi:Popeye-like protein
MTLLAAMTFPSHSSQLLAIASPHAGVSWASLQIASWVANWLTEEKTMNFFSPNYFIHAANVLLLVAYSVRDILWLRLFAVGASFISIPYFVLQPTPLWAPLSWSVVFAAINLLQSWRLFMERRPVKLTPEEEEIRRLAFRDLPPRKVLQVLSIGRWTTLDVGEQLMENGKVPGAVSLIVRGKVRVTRAGRVLGELIAGDLVGSALILSGIPAEVDAVTVEQGRAMRWEIPALERYLTANPETRTVMLQHVARDLAEKMERVTGPSSKRPDKIR